MIDVLLVDDDPQVCRYLEEMLTTDPGLRVVGHAHDGPDAVRRAVDLRPDVVLLDLRMPGGDGLEAIEPITRHGSRIVVLTAYDTDRDVDTALRRGASGFVLKSTDHHGLLDVVRAAAAGHLVLSGRAARRVTAPAADSRALAGMIRDALTDRELATIRGLAAGMSNQQLADELGISVPTVKGHVSSLVRKLGCENRLQAGLLARDAGLDRT